jgi:hypothetical protein
VRALSLQIAINCDFAVSLTIATGSAFTQKTRIWDVDDSQRFPPHRVPPADSCHPMMKDGVAVENDEIHKAKKSQK